jgi:DNA-binding transcriptional MerR regulator
MGALLRIGEVAEAAGVSRDTVRHYERRGVLPPAHRTAGGYRLYPPAIVNRVALVRRALVVGFSLNELARLFKERDRGGAPCRSVRQLVGERLGALEQRIEDLVELRGELRAMVKDWDTRLARTPAGRQARLLDTLVSRPSPREDS